MTTPLKEKANKIELHYFFADNSHAMNALVRNKCESYLLGIIKEISSILNARVQIETEAFNEGGLKERFVLVGKSEFLQSFTASIFNDVLPLEVDLQKTVNEEDKDETKQRIDKLRKELREYEKDSKSKLDMENVVSVFESNLKIIKRKSNFYKQISACPKVTKLSAQLLDAENKELKKAVTVSRKKFDAFMLEGDALKPEIDKDATIEIVSPVLKMGSYKWKGIYVQTGKTINFSMKDVEFKNDVISQSIPFKNGTRIDCSLEINRKMNEFGEEVITGYSVLEVISKQDDEVVTEIVKQKPAKKKKEREMQQLDLFASMFQ